MLFVRLLKFEVKPCLCRLLMATFLRQPTACQVSHNIRTSDGDVFCLKATLKVGQELFWAFWMLNNIKSGLDIYKVA